MTTSLIPVQDIERMAAAVAKSGLFGGVKTADQAMALMLVAQAEGLHPAIAARDYHIIEGRPALKADAMLARFQAAGGKVQWTCMTETRVAGVFSHPQGGSVEIEWTIDMATRAGLADRPNWKKYRRAMLRSRVISEGIRSVFPGVVAGTYTPEEVQDLVEESRASRRPSGPKNMGSAEVVVDKDDLIERINAATTIQALEAIRPDIRRMPPGDEKKAALAAAMARAERIRAEQARAAGPDAPQDITIDGETGEILPPEDQPEGAPV